MQIYVLQFAKKIFSTFKLCTQYAKTKDKFFCKINVKNKTLNFVQVARAVWTRRLTVGRVHVLLDTPAVIVPPLQVNLVNNDLAYVKSGENTIVTMYFSFHEMSKKFTNCEKKFIMSELFIIMSEKSFSRYLGLGVGCDEWRLLCPDSRPHEHVGCSQVLYKHWGYIGNHSQCSRSDWSTELVPDRY